MPTTQTKEDKSSRHPLVKRADKGEAYTVWAGPPNRWEGRGAGALIDPWNGKATLGELEVYARNDRTIQALLPILRGKTLGCASDTLGMADVIAKIANE